MSTKYLSCLLRLEPSAALAPPPERRWSHTNAAAPPALVENTEILAWSQEWSEGAVTNATRRLRRLAEILEAVQAASDLGVRAQEATDKVIQYGKVIVGRPSRGDFCIHLLSVEMFQIVS